MTAQDKIYSIFAELFEYPREDMKEATQRCMDVVGSCPQYPPEVMDELKKFLEEIADMPLDDLQGIYSYTFEIASGELTLDIGYHLFEGFKRSNNLATLKGIYKSRGFPFDTMAKGELPDYLPVVLKFLDFLEDEELKGEMSETFLVKGLEKLNKNFEVSQRETHYRHLVKAIWLIVDTDIKCSEVKKKEKEGYHA